MMNWRGAKSIQPLMNVGSEESTRALNLTVLQRLDPFVGDILITAAHVTLYQFHNDLNQWSRKDVEGSLFVVKRNKQPRFQFIVMNRRSTDNLVEDLLGDFEYEVQKPYLLYRNATQEVNGIWFYNLQDCDAVASLFNRILDTYAKVPPKPKASATKSEFEELEAIPTSSVIEGPLEPPSSAAPPFAHVPDESFMNFFNQPINIGSVSNATTAAKPQQFPASIPLASHVPKVKPSTLPTVQPYSLQSSSTPLPLFDSHESSSVMSNHVANLIKLPLFSSSPSPQLMMPPISSSMPTAPPLLPLVTMQHGTPLLQPFPPPNPSPSLATASNHGMVITKEGVREALTRLVMIDEFVDLVYREIVNAENS